MEPVWEIGSNKPVIVRFFVQFPFILTDLNALWAHCFLHVHCDAVMMREVHLFLQYVFVLVCVYWRGLSPVKARGYLESKYILMNAASRCVKFLSPFLPLPGLNLS